MDASPFIKGMLSQPALRIFLSDNVPANDRSFHEDYKRSISRKIVSFLMKIKFDLVEDTEDNKKELIECMQLEARLIGCASRKQYPSLVKYWKKTLYSNISEMLSCNYLKQKDELEHKEIDAVINSLDGIKEKGLFPQKASSNCLTNEEKDRAFFLMKAFPALRELNEPYKILEFLLELTKELDNLPQLIYQACEGQPLVSLLIGSLLSFKPRVYDTWMKVKDDLVRIKESDNGATNNHLQHIFNYCYDDLADFLKPCFLYLACYPIDYEIHASSLTQIWVAEGFITPEEGETTEEMAIKYLEQLVQRSLIREPKRSLLGTIECFRLDRYIHEYVIKQSYKGGFLAANPAQKEIKSMSRVAINHDNKKQTQFLVLDRRMASFIAIDVDGIHVNMSDMLWVLELRNSTIPNIPLISMCHLRYLGLRGSNISELPKNIGNMKRLQTLDVRDTSIKTVPESLWAITTLRHVYVSPIHQIMGPPSTANISDLQIMKTIAVHKSWLENFPHFLINLRKFSLLNSDNSYWKSISYVLIRMVNLLSMRIVGDILPSEFVDTRAFPNLETVKVIKFVGKWSCRNLIIDNVKFPRNLTKLTLTNSGLKEDPMPRLERLQALKFLSLKDGAYMGHEMVCSANGFPQLQFLELNNFENLENLDVKMMAMSQLVTLDVVQCPKLKKPLHLEHVNITGLDN